MTRTHLFHDLSCYTTVEHLPDAMLYTYFTSCRSFFFQCRQKPARASCQFVIVELSPHASEAVAKYGGKAKTTSDLEVIFTVLWLYSEGRGLLQGSILASFKL